MVVKNGNSFKPASEKSRPIQKYNGQAQEHPKNEGSRVPGNLTSLIPQTPEPGVLSEAQGFSPIAGFDLLFVFTDRLSPLTHQGTDSWKWLPQASMTFASFVTDTSFIPST